MDVMLLYCVYVLRSEKDGDFYVGLTADLPRRLGEHERGESLATAPRRPFTLLFCEPFTSAGDARRRERYLKTVKGRRALRLMLRDSLNPTTG